MSWQLTSFVILAVVLLGTLAVVPVADSAVSVTYSVTSGTAGDNGWYLSDVVAAMCSSTAWLALCLTSVHGLARRRKSAD